jgi:hypothetical protein
MQLGAGMPYMAAVLGPPIKQRYGYSQTGVIIMQTM